CARGRRDGAGEGDEGDAGCGHESILLIATGFCFADNSVAGNSIPSRTVCTLLCTRCAILFLLCGRAVCTESGRICASRTDEAFENNRPALMRERRAVVFCFRSAFQYASGSGRT